MLLTGHKSRAIFDRYNIINGQELPRRRGSARRLSGAAGAVPFKLIPSDGVVFRRGMSQSATGFLHFAGGIVVNAPSDVGVPACSNLKRTDP